jgi:diacylglycerol O-acyltransferase
LTVLLDASPEGREIPPPSPGNGERRPGDLEMLGRGLLGLPRQPMRALRSAPTTLPNLLSLPGATALPLVPRLTRGLAAISRLAGRGPDDAVLEITSARAPRTSFNGPISAHRGCSFGRLSLDSVKALKNELGITVNDVVVALCASAVRHWLLERDELPDDPLIAMVPVSVRTPEQFGTYGNRISMMVVPIPTNEPDPRRRLLRTHEYLRSAKELHKALPADILTDATSFIPPAVAARAARTTVDVLSRTRPPLNLVISNVPGPRNPLYLAGAKLLANYPVSVVVDGVGLNITVMSYLDHLDFGIVTDRDQISEPWELMDGLARSLDEFEEVICGRRLRFSTDEGGRPAAEARGGRRPTVSTSRS